MKNILVIDDEQSITRLIKTVFTKMGFNVETALDGEEGIKKFDSSRFDIVITDIRMPGVDGNDVVKHIRGSQRRKTPIIGISGTPWLLGKNDFDAVLPKPTTLNDLISTVTAVGVKSQIKKPELQTFD